MAKLACRHLVLAVERKLRARVVVESPVIPRAGVVALATQHAQAVLMLVVLEVAGHTGDLGVLEARAGGVALGTGQSAVFSQQRKARKSMFVFLYVPGFVVVAFRAFRTLLALVLVVLLMTTEAFQRRLAKAAQVFMAGLAIHRGFAMRIAQHELGKFVLEAPLRLLPVALGMAFGALLTQVTLVFVVLRMAAQAILGRFLEHRALVAILANGLGVFAEQGETGLVVVELG